MQKANQHTTSRNLATGCARVCVDMPIALRDALAHAARLQGISLDDLVLKTMTQHVEAVWQDRRSSARVPADTTALVRVTAHEQGPQVFSCKLSDVSLGGIGLQVEGAEAVDALRSSLAVRSALELVFILPGEVMPVRVRCEACRIIDGESLRVGARIVEGSERSFDILQAYVN